jgi:hypothetical protein
MPPQRGDRLADIEATEDKRPEAVPKPVELTRARKCILQKSEASARIKETNANYWKQSSKYAPR